MGDPHISYMPKLEHVLRGIKMDQSKKNKGTSKPWGLLVHNLYVAVTCNTMANWHVRSALSKAGLNPDVYAGHSFRIGTATVVNEKGIEDTTIVTLGRWKSSTYQCYIGISQEHLACISAHIASPTSSQTHVTTFRLPLDN